MKSSFSTSVSEYASDNKINRYLLRIQQIMTKDKSRSPNPHNQKIHRNHNNKGPMINRLDSYLKYEHSLQAIVRFLNRKSQSLMKQALISMKFTQRQSQKQKIYKFITIPQSIQKNKSTQSNILLYRISNMVKNEMKESFNLLKKSKVLLNQQKPIELQQSKNRKLNRLIAIVFNKVEKILFNTFKRINEYYKFQIQIYYKIKALFHLFRRKIQLRVLSCLNILKINSQNSIRKTSIYLNKSQTQSRYQKSKRSDRKSNLLALARKFGRMFNILETRFNITYQSFFQQFYLINVKLKSIKKITLIYQHNVYRKFLESIQNINREKQLIKRLEKLNKIVNQFNAIILYKSIERIKAYSVSKAEMRKIKSINSINMIEKIDNIYRQKLIKYFNLIKISSKNSKRKIQMKQLFQNVKQFLNLRNRTYNEMISKIDMDQQYKKELIEYSLQASLEDQFQSLQSHINNF